MKASAGKRVLMLLENNPYPADPRVRQEAGTLVRAGYQVSVICPRGAGQPWRDDIDGVSVFRYPSPLEARGLAGYCLEYGLALVEMFAVSLVVSLGRGFDIIHAANPPDSAVLIALVYKLFGKRFVFDHHDLAPEMYLVRSDQPKSRLVHRMLLWLEHLSFHYADHVIATNQSYKQVALRRGHVPEERITVVRNGPALDRFRPVPPDPELKQTGKAIIGYIGAMGPQDGLDYLLRALQQLVTVLGREDFRCVIIGKGSALPDLKKQASALGLDSYVWFTGFIPDEAMLRYLSATDLCVDPDPSNEFNDRCTMIKMVEYMALGKPIVAFDLPEHRVTAGDAAAYARPNDELDFARLIAALMDDPERRTKMGQTGRMRVEQELAWPYQAPHLLEAYETLTTAPLRARASYQQ